MTAAPDLDWQLRLAAFARLEHLRTARGGVVTAGDLDTGFEFRGERIKFWNRQMGIWRPPPARPRARRPRDGHRPAQAGRRPP